MSGHSIIRKLVHGGAWAFVGKIATYPLGLLLTMAFARLLSTADVGAYFLIMSLAMLGSALVQAGLATTMCKMVARALAENNPAGVRGTIRIGVFALVVGSLIAYLILTNKPGHWLLSRIDGGDVLLTLVPWIAAMVVLFAAINYCCEILRGFSKLPAAALLDQQLLQRLLLFTILVVPVLLGIQLALFDVVRLSVSAAVFSALLGLFLVARQVRQTGSHGPGVKPAAVISQAPAFFLIRLNAWLLNSAAIWIVGVTQPLEETAMYGAGNAIALLVLAGWQVVSAAIGPAVVTLHSENRSGDLESVVRTAAVFGAVPALLLSIVLVVFGAEILALLFTSAYTQAATILAILAIGRAASTLFGLPMAVLSMTHHQDTVVRVLSFTAVATLGGFLWVANNYGAVGVAYVSAASAIFQGMIMSRMVSGKIGISTLPYLTASGLREFVSRLANSKN